MELGRVAVWTTVVVIAVATVLSGPLVGAVDLTHPRESQPGEGAVDLSVVSVPTDGVRLDRGRYGTKGYTLRVPDAVVSVEAVRGEPLVVYKIRIPELGYVRASLHVLTERHRGSRYRLSLEPDVLDSERLSRNAYDAELLVVVRGGNAADFVAQRNVTVEVRG